MVGIFLVAAALSATAVPPALAMGRRRDMLPATGPAGRTPAKEADGGDEVEPTLAL
jgi:hypothetical protein